MQRTRIKICGLTRPDDAAAAIAAGADAIGVIFAPSPRQVSLERARKALADVGPFVARIGVFVDAPREVMLEAIERCGLTAVQLSGHEPPEACDGLPVPAIKVLHVGTAFDTSAPEPYRGHAAALLLDTYSADKAGGTSQAFDWHTVGEVPGWAPIIVAGGLDPRNVGACIEALHPYAIDASSGVEASPGIKDHDRIRAFCSAVRAADERGSR